MNLRPRCREWLPLSTQQLRLRNLAKIHGYNIVCGPNGRDEEVFIYYTLHRDKDTTAFYSSEALPQRRMEQKWAEIDAGDNLRKSNSNCVCVKVWARWVRRSVGHQTETESLLLTCNAVNNGGDNKERKCALIDQLSNICLTRESLPRPPEQLLFTWGVYFSGLIPLSHRTEAKYRVNCLVFQLNDEYFTSPAYVTPEGLREQLSLSYQRYSTSLPKAQTLGKRDDVFSINSPTASRSSSPEGNNLQHDLLRMSTARYTQLLCVAAEVRNSYDQKQLLKIQELQRLHLQKLRDCHTISGEIRKVSVRCITRSELHCKPRTTSISSGGTVSAAAQHNAPSYSHHSMGCKLSVLLAEDKLIEPQQLYAAQQLQQKIETLRSKKRLLQMEHTTYAKRIVAQREHLLELQQKRNDRKTWLAEQNAKLEQQRIELLAEVQAQCERKMQRRHIIQQVERRMAALCLELREIYNIGRKGTSGAYSICGITCPNMQAFLGDTQSYEHHMNLEHISPLAISAALGYIGHLVQMIAIIINRPLRNPIIYETSRTRIMDVVKELPYASREFPLYTRTLLPSKPVKYAIYLLNQNIAQLCYDITGRRCDMRATFENILHIFNVLEELERSHREIRAELQGITTATSTTQPSQRLVLYEDEETEETVDGCSAEASTSSNAANDHDQCNDDSLSKSHSSVDMNHVPVPPPSALATNSHLIPHDFLKLLPTPAPSQALAIEGFASTQRICRSVGSYSDCEEDYRAVGISEHTYSNSDSNIQFQAERSS